MTSSGSVSFIVFLHSGSGISVQLLFCTAITVENTFRICVPLSLAPVVGSQDAILDLRSTGSGASHGRLTHPRGGPNTHMFIFYRGSISHILFPLPLSPFSLSGSSSFSAPTPPGPCSWSSPTGPLLLRPTPPGPCSSELADRTSAPPPRGVAADQRLGGGGVMGRQRGGRGEGRRGGGGREGRGAASRRREGTAARSSPRGGRPWRRGEARCAGRGGGARLQRRPLQIQFFLHTFKK